MIWLVFIATMIIADGAGAYLLIEPMLSTKNTYDDNPRIRTDDLANDLVFTTNELKFDSTYVRPTYQVGITPRFRFSRYSEDTELDSEEYFVSSFANKLFERHQVGASFNFANQASFFTEFDDSGLFNVNISRVTLSGRVNWSYFLSEKVTLLFNGQVSDISYEDDPRSRFIDYFLYGAGASVNYRFSESTSFWLIFNRSTFKTPQISSETESHSFQLGFDHQLTETSEVLFRIGKNISNLEFKQTQLALISQNPPVIGPVIVDAEENQSGDVIQFQVKKEFSKANLKMQWDRRFSPSSQGARQEIEEVSGNLKYRLTQSVNLIGRVRHRTRIQEGQLIRTRLEDLETLDYGGSVAYRFSPNLSTEIGYGYRQQIFRGISREAHRVFLALRYRPPELRLW